MFNSLQRKEKGLLFFMLAAGMLYVAAGWIGSEFFQRKVIEIPAQQQAQHWATFLSENLGDPRSVFGEGRVSGRDRELLASISANGDVLRYRIYNPDGVAVVASSAAELRHRIAQPFFENTVRLGRVHTQPEYFHEHGIWSLLGFSDDAARAERARRLSLRTGRQSYNPDALLRVYAPVMQGNEFLGALELHFDVSPLHWSLHGQVGRARLALIGLFVVAALVVGLVMHLSAQDRNSQLATLARAHETMAVAEQRVLELNEGLERRVEERTAELNQAYDGLNEANERVKALNEHLERRVEERTEALFKANEQLNSANESVSRLNEELERRVEQRTAELNKANERVIRLNEELERRVEERTAELNMANERVMRMNEELERRVNERTAELNEANENVTKLNEELEKRVLDRTAELRRAQADLLRSERLVALGQLTATVAHELRNPLGAIRTGVYLISSRVKDRGLGVEKALGRTDRSITRCDNIISELLDYTRITELDLETLSFDNWLKDVLSEQTLPEGITLREEIQTAGVQVAIDQDRFRRVVINVFNNACEAMREDQAKGNSDRNLSITVTTKTANDRFEVAFKDTGPGIEPEVLEKIFEPLYSTKSFGVGLGLPTVRQVMEQHGGGIDITSVVGEGTTVSLWLPLKHVDERAA